MNSLLRASCKLASLQIPRAVKFSLPQQRRFALNLDPNTNVAKDVILFKYENQKLFRAINFFSIAQFAFWTWLSYFSLTSLKDAPAVTSETGEKLPLWRRINLGENKYRNGIAGICFLMGWGILTVAWMFTLRSVRLLVLRKGGQFVSLVTYTPLGKDRIMDVPLKCISAAESRHTAKTTLPLKLKGKTLFYVLDMRGEFRNAQLFDQTLGVRRSFVK